MKAIHISILLIMTVLTGCGTKERDQRILAENERDAQEGRLFMAEVRRVTKAHGDCLQKEAAHKRLDKLDLETATHAAVASCVEFQTEYYNLTRRYFRANPGFHARLQEGAEEKTFDLAKKLIALRRAYN